jgi:hypothetical protein
VRFHRPLLPSGHETKRFQPPGHRAGQLSREPLDGRAGGAPLATIIRELPLAPYAVASELSKLVAPPGRFWLTQRYQREPWLEGRVSDQTFLVWLKRPRQSPPLARARGKITEIPTGSRVVIKIPAKPSLPGSLLAFALLGWLISFALVVADFAGATPIPWAPYLAVPFGVVAVIGLIMSLSQAEARELERHLASAVDNLGPPAA